MGTDDANQSQAPHWGWDWYIRVSRGGDEVEAAVDTSVRDAFLPGDVHLLLQELLVLLVDVLLDGLPAAGRGGGVGGESRWMSRKDRTWELAMGMVPLQPPHFLFLPGESRVPAEHSPSASRRWLSLSARPELLRTPGPLTGPREPAEPITLQRVPHAFPGSLPYWLGGRLWRRLCTALRLSSHE